MLTQQANFAHVGAEGGHFRPGRALASAIVARVLARQRSLLPALPGSAVEGWMDDDVASAASQLFGSGPRGLLVIDARELLTSTARVVGAQLGEIHFKVWMALITLHVAHGMPDDGRGSSAFGEFTRIVWGADKAHGSTARRQLLGALMDLHEARFTVAGYDLVNQRPAPAASSTSLLINLVVDDAILKSYEEAATRGAETPEQLQARQRQIGQAVGGKRRGTLAWRLHPDYTQRLADADLRRFDWTKAQQLRGVALALWLVFTSARVPYRPLLGEGRELEGVEIPLTPEHCQALGVRAGVDAARRRTLNDAGARVAAVDKSFIAFEAHGGRGVDSFLRIVRRRPMDSPLERPLGPPPGQMILAA